MNQWERRALLETARRGVRNTGRYAVPRSTFASVQWNPGAIEWAKSTCSGRGSAWLERLRGVQEVVGSNPAAPIILCERMSLLVTVQIESKRI